jgi:hypothetical protein
VKKFLVLGIIALMIYMGAIVLYLINLIIFDVIKVIYEILTIKNAEKLFDNRQIVEATFS